MEKNPLKPIPMDYQQISLNNNISKHFTIIKQTQEMQQQ